jgi:hypothetical protein
MATVQMLVTISGSHASGNPWPPAGGTIELDDWESDHLILGEMARPVGDVPPPEPEPEPETPEPVSEGEEPAPSGEVPTSAPKGIQPKADWVAWAMVNGLTEDEANQLTKAELMEQFGARA